ncbi:MAG: SPOR domain-containing protein [Acidobacteria bacterium]|nr:SPOR domain-containing protein [Acidobacteriota bacterium]
MPEESRYDNRQSVMLFVAGVAMCAAFFVFGLLVGRWSAKQADRPASNEPVASQPASQGVQPSSVPEPPVAAAQETPAETKSGADEPPLGTGDEDTMEDPPTRPALDGPPREALAFVVRAANFGKSDDAETFAATLRSRGFGNARTRREADGKRSYSVVLGPYARRDEASRVAAELRNNGVSNVLVVSER